MTYESGPGWDQPTTEPSRRAVEFRAVAERLGLIAAMKHARNLGADRAEVEALADAYANERQESP